MTTKLSHKKLVERARKKRDRAYDKIFTYAEHGHMKFSDYLSRANETDRTAFETARRELLDTEIAAVSDGKAYWGTFNQLTWYR